MGDKDNKSDIREQGDVFFFYRPKVDTEEVEDLRDVQRFYMITAPEDNTKLQVISNRSETIT
jgi:hypothetical protein